MLASLAGVLRIVLPKGSLEKATLELFEAADLEVIRSSSVDYKATIADPRVADVRILRPQEIPVYVAEGLFDVGITGRDWVEETASSIVSLGELEYSKATSNPVNVVDCVGDLDPGQPVTLRIAALMTADSGRSLGNLALGWLRHCRLLRPRRQGGWQGPSA